MIAFGKAVETVGVVAAAAILAVVLFTSGLKAKVSDCTDCTFVAPGGLTLRTFTPDAPGGLYAGNVLVRPLVVPPELHGLTCRHAMLIRVFNGRVLWARCIR